MSAMVSVLVIVAAVPLFVVAGMLKCRYTEYIDGDWICNNGNGNRYCMCIRQRSRSLECPDVRSDLFDMKS